MADEAVPTHDQVVDGCKEILAENQRGDYTIPAQGLYPHQWLWDSCFIAIGLAEYDLERAKKEIESLLRGQWSNGMLPHMIFADGDKHNRDRNIWQSWRSPFAPDHLATSGFTQPPVLAEAVVQIGEKMKKTERRGWYQDMYPALLAYHQWMYNERDPHGEGLILLIHPWESGLDNSPPWIDQLHVHSRPWWVNVIDKTKIDKIVLLFRRDTNHHVPPGQRLSNIDAILYFTIIQRLKRKNWDIERILARSHFSFHDLTFNSILVRANEHLRSIAKTIGRELPAELVENMQKTEDSLEKLWDGFYKQYFPQTFITHKLVKEPTIATLMPLYAGSITKERAAELVTLLKSEKHFGTKYPIPTVPLSSNWYKEYGYWQGPAWINTNWLIADGLRRYGFEKEANHIIDMSINAVSQHGPYEYFSAKSGEPAGAKNFSWSAALTIKMITSRSKK
jgi:hypothetical protein